MATTSPSLCVFHLSESKDEFGKPLYNVFARHAHRPIGIVGYTPATEEFVYWPTTSRYLRSPEMREIVDFIKGLNK